MNRRGVAVLAVLVVLSLAAAAVTTVLAVVSTEVAAARAATDDLHVEAGLVQLAQEVLADRSRLTGSPPVWPGDSLRQVAAGPAGPVGGGHGLWLELEARAGPARRRMALIVQVVPDSLGPRLLPVAARGALLPIY